MAKREFDEVNIKVEFNETANRQQISSGDNVNTLFGKIRKWLSDLKPVALSGSYNDLSEKPELTTSLAVTEEGVSVLDGTIGKTLNDKGLQISVYKGDDGNLHFRDWTGADTVIPFNKSKSSYKIIETASYTFDQNYSQIIVICVYRSGSANAGIGYGGSGTVTLNYGDGRGYSRIVYINNVSAGEYISFAGNSNYFFNYILFDASYNESYTQELRISAPESKYVVISSKAEVAYQLYGRDCYIRLNGQTLNSIGSSLNTVNGTFKASKGQVITAIAQYASGSYMHITEYN